MASREPPTTEELKAAYKRCGIWRLGWTYDQAINTKPVRTALTCAALARRNQSAQTAPLAQPRLI